MHFFVDLDYENIPDYCTNCKKIGHYLEICKNVKRDFAQEEIVGNTGFNKVQKKTYVPVKERRQEQGRNIENPIVVENSTKDGTKSHLKETALTDMVGTSGCKQSNRFQALQEITGNIQATAVDTMKEHDLCLEKEINAELTLQQVNNNAESEDDSKDSDSEKSEFVDATQTQVLEGNTIQSDHMVENTNHSPGNEVNVVQDGDIEGLQDSLQQLDNSNRKFLLQAWANMAEDGEAKHRLLVALETDPSDLQTPVNVEDFQVVSRKKGKAQKSTLKSNYSTRAKASHPKPFK